MPWDKSLESDIPVIDYEHKELITLVDRLTENPGPELAREILDFLSDYVVKHFAHEQVMHKKTRYPKAEEHRQIHADFVDAVIALDQEYRDSGSSPEVLEKLVSILNAWLRDHIMGVDMEFAAYFKNYRPMPGASKLGPLA